MDIAEKRARTVRVWKMDTNAEKLWADLESCAESRLQHTDIISETVRVWKMDMNAEKLWADLVSYAESSLVHTDIISETDDLCTLVARLCIYSEHFLNCQVTIALLDVHVVYTCAASVDAQLPLDPEDLLLNLPDEVIRDVLSRVSFKDILCLGCANKSWKFEIKRVNRLYDIYRQLVISGHPELKTEWMMRVFECSHYRLSQLFLDVARRY